LAGFHNDQVNSLILSLWPLLVLLGFLGLQRHKSFTPETSYLLYSAFLPVLLALGLSFAIRPVFLSRYLIITLPSLYLLLAWLVSRYQPSAALATKTILVTGIAAMLLVQNFNYATPVKENYLAASRYLEERTTAQDIVAVSAPFTIYPIDYYYRGQALLTTLPAWDRFQSGPIPAFTPETLEADLAKLRQSHQTLWVLLSYDQGYEEEVRLYLDNNFERIDAREFSPGLTLYAYKLRYDQEPFATAVARLKREQESGPAIAAPPSENTTASLVGRPAR
jgi:hypothetical protein